MKYFLRTIIKTRTIIASALVLFAASPFWPVDLEKYIQESPAMYDRNGELIHIERNAHDCWVLKTQQVDEQFKKLLLNFEDKWFYQHPGINPLALARACFQAISNRKIVSGGSTITMQVARMLDPGPRTFFKKLIEMHTALRLTTRYSKDEVLKIYLTLAPYGGNIHGIRTASLYYFGKEPEFLPLSYKAMLVAIPQSPSCLRPDRAIALANLAKNKVLKRQNPQSEEVREALEEACQITATPFVKLATHAFRLQNTAKAIHTLDRAIQQSVANLLNDYVQKLPIPMTAACVVYNYKTQEILAYVGAVGGGARMAGNDMCRAIRSPGSLLKPLVYGLAMERGYINPQTLITDRAINLKGYMPENFDMQFCGELTIEEALQQSLNTTVVQVLNQMGPGYFFDWLKLSHVEMHFNSKNHKRPGLAIGLGGIGLSLTELVKLYGAMAKGDLFSKNSSAWIHQTLGQTPMPDQRHKNPGIAYKTGTSYGYRDAWSIGFDSQYVIGIWVGRADGTPCPGYYGLKISAPLMMQIFKHFGLSPLEFSNSHEASPSLTKKSLRFKTSEKEIFQIAMPKKASTILVADGQEVYLQSNGNEIVHWYINGAFIGESNSAIAWKPKGEGFFQITAMNACKDIDTCEIEIKNSP